MSQRAAWSAWIRMVASLSAFAAGCGDVSGSEKTPPPEGGYTTAAIDASSDRATDGASLTGDANVGAYSDATTGAVVAASMDGNALGANADAADTGTPRATVEGGCDARAGADCGPATSAACDLASCPTGCCDAEDQCQPGQAPANCGAGGSACQVCPPGSGCIECPPGQICAAERFCGCDPASCPSGCCSGGGIYGGTCQSGTFDDACGTAGIVCKDCTTSNARMNGPGGLGPAAGACSNQQCVYPPPSPCLFGCIDPLGACQPGASDTQCGSAGAACTDCTTSGGECSNQQCGPFDDARVCNEQTCPSGCCDDRAVCELGTASTACGTGGVTCLSCVALGQSCSNQRCTGADGGAGCGSFNCGGCCDDSGACVPVDSDTNCGVKGNRCTDCATLGARCLLGACTSPDGAIPCAQSCAGCCDNSGTCQLGFIDTQCGGQGQSCQDCTSQTPASTCDLSVFPRTCASEQTTCPAVYAGCPVALQAQSPAHEAACSTTDLQNVAAACPGGPNSPTCRAFLEGESNCIACLQAFAYDFTIPFGVHACLAAYLDAMCNHSVACLDDCLTQACANCVVAATPAGPLLGYAAQCGTQAQTGTCASEVQASACANAVLDGAGALCNPATYQGNFGAWLQAVGAAYCGP